MHTHPNSPGAVIRTHLSADFGGSLERPPQGKAVAPGYAGAIPATGRAAKSVGLRRQ